MTTLNTVIKQDLKPYYNIENNNNKTKPIGGKKPNELGLYEFLEM